MSATTFLDSVVFGELWRSEAVAALLEEEARTRDWLEILAVLAEVEGEHGIIPPAAAHAIAGVCRTLSVDAAFLEEVREGRKASGHSTQGLIRALARRCPPGAGEWIQYGATVQDLTDTWFMRVLGKALKHLDGRLADAEASLTALAERHRDTIMAGRTHGQPGAPITFGLKAASWIAELRRSRERLAGLAGRIGTGQLAGAVGALGSLGPRALEVQARFCERLGLRAPDAPWTSSRDAFAEWGAVLAIATGTADRIAHEVYNLQRPELGELRERTPAGVVGSITMPHKRNPESSEHVGTLARLVRHLAAALIEGQVHDHERDGRSWKAEWHLLPEVTMLAARALELLADLVRDLEVDAARMRSNVEAAGGALGSERLMLALAAKVGRVTAHELVMSAAARARTLGTSLLEAARADPAVMAHLPGSDVSAALSSPSVGASGAIVDRVLRGVP